MLIAVVTTGDHGAVCVPRYAPKRSDRLMPCVWRRCLSTASYDGEVHKRDVSRSLECVPSPPKRKTLMPLESFASVLMLCLLCAECWKGLAMRRHFLFSVVKVVEATWVQFRYHGENNCSKNNQIIISTERVASPMVVCSLYGHSNPQSTALAARYKWPSARHPARQPAYWLSRAAPIHRQALNTTNHPRPALGVITARPGRRVGDSLHVDRALGVWSFAAMYIKVAGPL